MKYTRVVIIMALLLGCSVFRQTTNTPIPSSTPVPTSTPLPTTTPDTTPCYVKAKEFVSQLNSLMSVWGEGLDLMSQSPSDAVKGLAKLQQIKLEVDALAPPTCAKNVKSEIQGHMDAMINYYLAAWLHQDESILKSYEMDAGKHLIDFMRDFGTLLPPTP